MMNLTLIRLLSIVAATKTTGGSQSTNPAVATPANLPISPTTTGGSQSTNPTIDTPSQPENTPVPETLSIPQKLNNKADESKSFLNTLSSSIENNAGYNNLLKKVLKFFNSTYSSNFINLNFTIDQDEDSALQKIVDYTLNSDAYKGAETELNAQATTDPTGTSKNKFKSQFAMKMLNDFFITINSARKGNKLTSVWSKNRLKNISKYPLVIFMNLFLDVLNQNNPNAALNEISTDLKCIHALIDKISKLIETNGNEKKDATVYAQLKTEAELVSDCCLKLSNKADKIINESTFIDKSLILNAHYLKSYLSSLGSAISKFADVIAFPSDSKLVSNFIEVNDNLFHFARDILLMTVRKSHLTDFKIGSEASAFTTYWIRANVDDTTIKIHGLKDKDLYVDAKNPIQISTPNITTESTASVVKAPTTATTAESTSSSTLIFLLALGFIGFLLALYKFNKGDTPDEE